MLLAVGLPLKKNHLLGVSNHKWSVSDNDVGKVCNVLLN